MVCVKISAVTNERHGATTALGPVRVKQAARALERGVSFLLANQGPDGLWRDFMTPAGEASEWPSGVVGTALHAAGADGAALERAAAALAERQNPDGGWGYAEDVPTDADSTACVLLFLARTGRHGDACRRAAACLRRHQAEDGGVATYAEANSIRRFMGVPRWLRFRGWCAAHTEVTAAAGRALEALEPDNPDALAAWRHVRSRQRPDGSWAAYWWMSPHYSTLQAVELGLACGDGAAVRRAAAWAKGGGPSATGATPAFATALSLTLLLRAGSETQPVERALDLLAAIQENDGGWPSGPIMRIPLPGDIDPDRPRRVRFGGPGIMVADQHRTFTTAACVVALAAAAPSRGV